MFITTDRLDDAVLAKAVCEEVLAVQVKQFIPRETAMEIGQRILGQGFDSYVNAPDIGRIGMALYEAENIPARLDAYFDAALDNIDALRKRCMPYASPIDVLRCTLDEMWPAGAQLEHLYGRKAYVGLSRIVQPGVEFLAHHDILAKDAPETFRSHSLASQLAANIYLTMPTDGGGLHIWQSPISAAEFDDMRGDSYGIDPSLLGKPTLQIQPEEGDLVLFNSRRMHAVTPGSDKPRLSLSCFVGYRGVASPLTFWS